MQSNQAPFSVLNKGDYRFCNLLKTLDSLSSELHSARIGATKKSTKLKMKICSGRKVYVGTQHQKILQCTVFFYVGLNFVLRGIQEQYDLVVSQFRRVPQDTSAYYNKSFYYKYMEFISEYSQHRFKFYKINKVVCSYALPGEEHCMVKLLDKYLSLLPPTAPHFYMKAEEKFPTDPTVRCFINQRVGINQLKKMLPELSEKAGIGIRYIDHSHHATATMHSYVQW